MAITEEALLALATHSTLNRLEDLKSAITRVGLAARQTTTHASALGKALKALSEATSIGTRLEALTTKVSASGEAFSTSSEALKSLSSSMKAADLDSSALKKSADSLASSQERVAKMAANAQKALAKAGATTGPGSGAGAQTPQEPLPVSRYPRIQALNTRLAGTNAWLKSTFEHIPGLSALSSVSGIANVAVGAAGLAASAIAGVIGLAASAIAGAVTQLARGMQWAVGEASKLATAMSRVHVATDGSATQMRGMARQVRELSTRSGVSMEEAAGLQAAFGSAGFGANDTMSLTRTAASLSGASGMGTDASASSLAQVVRSLGIDDRLAAVVADSAVAAAGAGTLDASDVLATYQSSSALLARTAPEDRGEVLRGISELAGVLGDSNIRGADAAEVIDKSYGALMSPSEYGRQFIDAYAPAFSGRQLSAADVPDVLAALRSSLVNEDADVQSDVLKGIFGSEVPAGITAMMRTDPSRFEDLDVALDSSAGAAERAARMMRDNLSGDLEGLTQAANGLGATIGAAMLPGLRDSAQSVTDFVGALNESLVTTGLVEDGIGSFDDMFARFVDGIILFLEEFAPRIAGFLEMIGVLEDGSAERFAEEMASSMTDMRKRRAAQDAQSERDRVETEYRARDRSLRSVSGIVRSAEGTTGRELADDIAAQLTDAGLGDLLTDETVSTQLDELGRRGALTGRDRSTTLQSFVDSVATPLSDQRARNRQARDEQLHAIDGIADVADQTIEGSRRQSIEDARGRVSPENVLFGAAHPMGAIAIDLVASQRSASADQVRAVNDLKSVLQQIATNTARAPNTPVGRNEPGAP